MHALEEGKTDWRIGKLGFGFCPENVESVIYIYTCRHLYVMIQIRV